VEDEVAVLLGEDDPTPARPVPGSRRALFNRRRTSQSTPATRMFVLTRRWLERSDPAGRPALALLARAARFAAEEPVPRPVLLEAAADTRSAESLVRLLDLGLVEPDGERMVRVHREISDLVRLTPSGAAAQEAAEEAMIAWAQAANEAESAADRLQVVPHLD